MAAVHCPKSDVVFFSHELRYLIKIWDACEYHLLKQVPPLKLNPDLDYRFYDRPLKIVRPITSMPVVRFPEIWQADVK